MADVLRNEYDPDVVSPPGETLRETMEAIGRTSVELADRMGCSANAVAQLLTAEAAITPDIACQLESFLGVPARFWVHRERHYREWRAKQEETAVELSRSPS